MSSKRRKEKKNRVKNSVHTLLLIPLFLLTVFVARELSLKSHSHFSEGKLKAISSDKFELEDGQVFAIDSSTVTTNLDGERAELEKEQKVVVVFKDSLLFRPHASKIQVQVCNHPDLPYDEHNRGVH